MDILELYKREMSELPSLSSKEETHLGNLILKNVHKSTPESEKIFQYARNCLVSSNQQLIYHIILKNHYTGVPLIDLIAAGNDGLMMAATKFKPHKGKFSTYAVPRIKRAIQIYFQTKSVIYYPEYVYKNVGIIDRYIQKFELRHQRPPSNKEISLAVNIKSKAVSFYRGLLKNVLSIEYSKNGKGTLDQIIKNNNSPDPFQKTLDVTTQQIVSDALTHLKEIEMIVINYRYLNKKNYTFEEIGKIIHLTRERVRQIEKKALSRLRYNRKIMELL